MSDIKVVQNIPVDLTAPPTSPNVGDVLDEKYWIGIEGAINRCGERIFEIMKEYNEKAIQLSVDSTVIESSPLMKCGEDLMRLCKTYGEVVFACALDPFYNKVIGMEMANIFNWNVAICYEEMPDNLKKTVETLRYINTKWIEKKNRSIASLHRGENLTIDRK